jgi:hypothetical protein
MVAVRSDLGLTDSHPAQRAQGARLTPDEVRRFSMLQGFTVGSNARRVFCAPIRRQRRLAPMQVEPSALSLFHRREKRVMTAGPLERPWLRAARTAKGLRLKDVADHLGVSPSNAWRLEQHKDCCTTERKAALLQQLLGLTDEQRVELTTTLVTRWS